MPPTQNMYVATSVPNSMQAVHRVQQDARTNKYKVLEQTHWFSYHKYRMNSELAKTNDNNSP